MQVRFAAACLAFYFFASALYADPVIALVEGKAVHESKIKQALAALGEHGDFIANQADLRSSYRDHLLLMQAKAQRAQVLQLNKTSQFQARMKLAEEHILASLYTETWLAERLQEPALRAHFQKNERFFRRRAVKISHIQLSNVPQAKALLAEILLAGKKIDTRKFASLVKRHSQAKDADNDGCIDWFSKGNHSLLLERAAFTTDAGAVYPELVTSDEGVEIIRVMEVRDHDNAGFDLLKGEVKRFRQRELEAILSLELQAKIKAL